jgi:UDP-glucuronate 4-epimerase
MTPSSDLTPKKILVTGCAGFLGFHLCKRLINNNFIVRGLDNLNNSCNFGLQESRLGQLGIEIKCLEQRSRNEFHFFKQDILNKEALLTLFEKESFTHIIHLAAQPGVRLSIQNPQLYLDQNIQGFFNILETCRIHPPKHLIFASSSSVYGLNNQMPSSISDNTDHPISFYALSKKTNELMAYLYSHLYGISCTGLRFFTVYGPWGRPDMAYFDFTRKILKGEPIDIFNNGNLMRDFTYIDDVIDGVIRLIDRPPEDYSYTSSEKNDINSRYVPYNLFNIGGHNPIKLGEFIQLLEDILGIKAKKTYKCMQPGDVKDTYADISDLSDYIGFIPSTSFKEGLIKFVDWYYEYFLVK